MIVVGVDLSLTSTGVADDFGVRCIKPRLKGMERIEFITKEILARDVLTQPHLFVLEGYSFGSHASHAHELGELGGVLRHELWARGIPYADVPPASLKRYATGKGNASKEMILGEAIRRLGYAGSSNDEADALWLRAMGLEAIGKPIVKLPANHREALNKISWPRVVEAIA